MKASSDGLLLLGSSHHPIYANSEAIEILAYPDKPGKKSPDGFLAKKVQLLLNNPASPQSGFVTEFTSGRRRYVCRAFSLDSHSGNSPHQPSTALLIERGGKIPRDTWHLAEQFRLSQRERETVEYLLHGLTSKEIATRMNISPNTVKAFVRLIMVKMGASTRSGIVGKIFGAA
jgi:DNA-binding CsgD family transcriptional regulator